MIQYASNSGVDGQVGYLLEPIADRDEKIPKKGAIVYKVTPLLQTSFHLVKYSMVSILKVTFFIATTRTTKKLKFPR